MRKSRFLFALSMVFLLFSCKEDDVVPPAPVVDQLKITMQPFYGASPLALEQVVLTPEGYKVQFTGLKCYFTSLKNGSKTLTQAALYDFAENGTLVTQVDGKPSDFASLTGYLGVDPSYNHNDPSAFPNENPLNIMIANDMHWDWNPGYIFLKVEAKVDTLDDGVDNFNHFVVFHVGSDQIIQPLSFSTLNWANNGNGIHSLALKVDLLKFLQNGSNSLDLKTEYTSHNMSGQEAISLKVIEQFKNAISLY
jgi:hypothetical protein